MVQSRYYNVQCKSMTKWMIETFSHFTFCPKTEIPNNGWHGPPRPHFGCSTLSVYDLFNDLLAVLTVRLCRISR